MNLKDTEVEPVHARHETDWFENLKKSNLSIALLFDFIANKCLFITKLKLISLIIVISLRLIKGDGEVLEEIVSKSRHREINKVKIL